MFSLTYTKNKLYKRVFGSIFRLESNNWCSAFTINTPKVNKSVQLRGAKNRNFDVNIFFLKYYRYIKEYLYITYPDGFQVNFLDF